MKDFQDRWTFLRPDGIAVPERGYKSQDMIIVFYVAKDEGITVLRIWPSAQEPATCTL